MFLVISEIVACFLVSILDCLCLCCCQFLAGFETLFYGFFIFAMVSFLSSSVKQVHFLDWYKRFIVIWAKPFPQSSKFYMIQELTPSANFQSVINTQRKGVSPFKVFCAKKLCVLEYITIEHLISIQQNSPCFQWANIQFLLNTRQFWKMWMTLMHCWQTLFDYFNAIIRL